MRKLLLIMLAIGVLAASPAMAAFTGSLYTTNFATHHVFRSDVVSNTVLSTSDLVGLPGADGIIFDPLDDTRLLVGGQLTNNIYMTGIFGGGYSTVNNSPIVNGALHLAIAPGEVGPKGLSIASSEVRVLTSGFEGPIPNSLAFVGLSSGNVDNRVVAGLARVSGIAYRGGTLYATDGDEHGYGGGLFTVNLVTNTATPLAVVGGHDMHNLWMDGWSGHLFASGAYYIEEIDLDAIGGPAVIREWDISGLLGPSPIPYLDHIDHIATDDAGNLFAAVNTGPLVYLDLTAGVPSPIIMHNYGVGLDAVVAGKTAVPEPSTLLLAGLGLLGAGLLRKRS
ncbi:MAG: PEP-CTERM sorting domain-containing protein [Candidatus Eisenbacteria bacterium]|nr:PEP-CTERM sorting domain-containing protein [Candidatus Eisenbacteria bacterium]